MRSAYRGVALGEQQPPAEHDRCHARAGLGVGAIGRQLPVVAERLVLVVRALPAGDVRAARDRVVPLAREGVEQLVVAGLDGDVDGAGREVVGAHGVAAQHLGVAHRHVVLVVRAAALDVGERAVAAPVDEEPRLLRCSAARRSRGRARRGRPRSRRARRPRSMPSSPKTSHTRSAARRAMPSRPSSASGPRALPRDRRLEQVPEAVELVPPLEVGPARAAGRVGRTSC